jgi:predicted transport protein
MPIYKNDKNSLHLIKEKVFRLERDIQSLVENNLTELFGIDFVETERIINGLRIDTLAFDSETKSFVIIEYKRGSSFSVVDQGFSYLSLLLNNKADFVLEYNEKNKTHLKRDEVNWSQSRIIFISPEYTRHQMNAVNFKDAPFELWEIKQYENSTILVQQLKNKEAQETMPNISDAPTLENIKKETKQYSEVELLANKQKGSNLYLLLKEKITEIYPELLFDPKSNSINLKRGDNWRVIVYINVSSDKIRLTFTRSNLTEFQDSKGYLVYVGEREVVNRGQELVRLEIKKESDIEYAVGLFQQAYLRFKQEFVGE